MTDEQAIAAAHLAIRLGDAVEAFLNSHAGQYLTSRIEQEIDEAVQDLKGADPEDPKAIRKAQNRIHMLEDLKVWIAEAIQTANEIERQMLAAPE